MLNSVKHSWSSPKMCSHLTNTIHGTDPVFAEEGFLEKPHNVILSFIATVQVKLLDIKMLGGIPMPHYNILLDNLQATNPDAWTSIHLFIMSLKYPTAMYGMGCSVHLSPCRICHFHTHSTGLCSFPSIPGWNGPPLRKRGPNYNKGCGQNWSIATNNHNMF